MRSSEASRTETGSGVTFRAEITADAGTEAEASDPVASLPMPLAPPRPVRDLGWMIGLPPKGPLRLPRLACGHPAGTRLPCPGGLSAAAALVHLSPLPGAGPARRLRRGDRTRRRGPQTTRHPDALPVCLGAGGDLDRAAQPAGTPTPEGLSAPTIRCALPHRRPVRHPPAGTGALGCGGDSKQERPDAPGEPCRD